jgi:hypothetical protein
MLALMVMLILASVLMLAEKFRGVMELMLLIPTFIVTLPMSLRLTTPLKFLRFMLTVLKLTRLAQRVLKP